KALSSLPFTIPMYIRYVDDIALMVPCDGLESVLDDFNSFHPRLQF
ncbi:hypothetical protein EAG_11060, partial [Camponotus floridanus]